MITVVNLFASTVAVALGLFAATSPARAASIWASGRLERLPDRSRTSFLRCYRAFGIVLCLGGALLALDSMLFSGWHH